MMNQSKPQTMTSSYSDHTVLDLFAGTGVGVALQQLGATELGVEIMPEAIQTRTNNGMRTLFNDVWEPTHDHWMVRADTLWASPPCQTFSMAGGGAGRRALDQVLAVIDTHDWKRAGLDDLKREALKIGDERIGLVLTPLAYAHFVQPEYILLEQVPPVLPVWQRMAVELEKWGYSTWTGILHAEMYGVPQTRKRAILIARRDGIPAAPPTPTHSKYHTTNPTKLDEGVEKWVSMYEALSWGMGRPAPTQTGHGGATRQASGHQAVYQTAINNEEFTFRPPFTPESARISNDSISLSRAFVADAVNASPDEAQLLQSYPPSGQYLKLQKMANSSIRHIDQPAQTLAFGHDAASAGWFPTREAAEAHLPGKFVQPGDEVQTGQAGVLQSYPNGFEFAGNKGKQFQQIGNAVPPLLAKAIFEEAWK